MAQAPRITLDQWRALAAVVDAGGYAQAADALHKSQSSVSYAVHQVESRLGVEAFEIDGRKAVLTPTGRLLYRRARALLDEATDLEQAARKLSAGWEPEIRIAVEIVFPGAVLFRALDRFGALAPQTRIEVYDSVLGGTPEALVDGHAELAITGIVPPGFLGELLMSVRFLLVASPSHPLHALGRPVTVQDLRKHRQLVVRESGSKRATRATVEAMQRWTLSHMSASIEAAGAGYGYAWLPEERIRAELADGTLAPLKMRGGGDRVAQLYLVYADRDAAGPGTLKLGELIAETTSAECRARHPADQDGKASVNAHYLNDAR
jgi:DNA-binding transcriptional LysR family regulator